MSEMGGWILGGNDSECNTETSMIDVVINSSVIYDLTFCLFFKYITFDFISCLINIYIYKYFKLKYQNLIVFVLFKFW